MSGFDESKASPYQVQRSKVVEVKRERDQDSNKNYMPNGNGHDPNWEQDRDPGPAKPTRLQPYLTAAEFLKDMTPALYTVDGLMVGGSMYFLTGRTGHGKTLLALLLAIRVATGGWFAGRECEQGAVLFIAGENYKNVQQQFYAMCKRYEVDPVKLPIYFHPGAFDLREEREAAGLQAWRIEDLKLVIIDSMQAMYWGNEENSNTEMLSMAVAAREFCGDHPGKPMKLVLAHPTKEAKQDGLVPRGGSASLNECDGNASLWTDSEAVTHFHWQGKWRGSDFEPVKYKIEPYDPEGLVDYKGRQITLKIIREMSEREASEQAQTVDDIDVAVLRLISANGRISLSTMAAMIHGATRFKVRAAKDRLQQEKLIKNRKGVWVLTSEGNQVLEAHGEHDDDN